LWFSLIKEKYILAHKKTVNLRRSSLFWDVTKHMMVVLLGLLEPEVGTNKLPGNVHKLLPICAID